MKKILCIGSLTTDVIVKHASTVPDAGTLRSVESITTHVGGCASNAAIDLAKLGVPVVFSGKTGKDNFGSFVKETLDKNGVDTRGLVVDDNASTTTSIVCIFESGERSFLYQPGSSSAFKAEDIDKALIDECDIIFYAGAMLMQSLDGEPIAELMKYAKSKGKYTVMDTAWDFEDIWLPKVEAVIPYLDLFMPSIEEAQKITGEQEINRIADRLFELGAENVIVKAGKDGALVCPKGMERKMLPTYLNFKPVDTTGAGDSFCAGFLAGLAQEWNYYDSAAFANAVGTHCIMCVGASTGIKPIADILKFMEENKI